MAVREPTRMLCSRALSSKSLLRAEEAQRYGTLVILGNTLTCECGARVGARYLPSGLIVPTRHVALDAGSSIAVAKRINQ